jgi:hypothetical protein
VTNFEASVGVGERFKGKNNPYPSIFRKLEDWRTMMKNGQPVSETVNTVLNVIRTDGPKFWNPTEPRVVGNFKEVYCDPTGARFSIGPKL